MPAECAAVLAVTRSTFALSAFSANVLASARSRRSTRSAKIGSKEIALIGPTMASSRPRAGGQHSVIRGHDIARSGHSRDAVFGFS